MPAEPSPLPPELLSLVVHEFRTPLGVVRGYLRMLGGGQVGTLPDEQRRVVEVAERSCERLVALLDQVAQVVRLMHGEAATWERCPVDVWSMVEAAAAHVEGGPWACAWETPGLRPLVDAEPVRLGTAIHSLLAAARRGYGDARTVQVAGRVDGTDVLLDIADDAASASEPHALPVDAESGGSGFDLPLAVRVVEAHGGLVFDLGGTRPRGLRVRLPLAEAAATRPPGNGV